jgi:hypothetical protein
MIQLVVITCISLAAKVKDTQVPLLLDLKVCFVLMFIIVLLSSSVFFFLCLVVM